MPMSARAGFWVTFLLLVLGAVVWFGVSGMTLADIQHIGTPRNAIVDGEEQIRVPLPAPADGRVLPEVPVTTDGPYAFMFTDGGEPVRFDPCRTVSYVIAAEGAPAGSEQLIHEAFDSVSAASGLAFVYAGTTTEKADFDRRLIQPDRYGDGWAPIIVGWADEGQVPDLAGTVTGLGGSSSVTGAYGPARYLQSGAVILDAPDISRLMATGDGQALARAVIMHEVAHVVGLGHVEDAAEIMNASNTSLADWGPGDLEGLAIAGAGPCEDV